MIVKTIYPERVTEVLAHHGEGAMWDERIQRLLWVDMLVGRVLATDPASGATDAVDIPDSVAAMIRPLRKGGHVIVGEHTVWICQIDDPSTPPVPVIHLPIPPGVRANEGASGPDGRLYVGTMAYAMTAHAGKVLAIGPSGEVATSLERTTVSNGTCLTPDGFALFIDSPTRAVMRYRVLDDGTWVNERLAVDLSREPGLPDGMCLDEAGNVWVAHWNGGSVTRHRPGGVKDMEVQLPLSRPTSCALGGVGGATLFITTSAYERTPGTDPDAGSLFAVTVDISGAPITPVVLNEGDVA